MDITIIWPLGKTPTTIGIRIEKVPQEVPVAKAKAAATRKITAGSRDCRAAAFPATMVDTNWSAPKRLVMPDRVQANVRIRMGEIIALNPSTKQFINSVKLITSRYI